MAGGFTMVDTSSPPRDRSRYLEEELGHEPAHVSDSEILNQATPATLGNGDDLADEQIKNGV